MSVGQVALSAAASTARPAGAASPAAAIISQSVNVGDAAPAPAPAAPPDPLAAMLSWAAARQDSLAPLLANLTALTGSPALPADAQATAGQILAVLQPLGEAATGEDLRTAALTSGVFLESTLATLSQSAVEEAPQLPPDLKALLLQLVSDLPPASTPAPAAEGRPQPPLPGQILGQTAAAPTLSPDASPQTIARVLGQQAQAALARLQLSQAASLTRGGHGAHWMFEVPVATPGGAAVAQFEISRDGGGSGSEAQGGWRARFSINAAPGGPVTADIALSGDRTRVTLVAPDDETRAALSASQGELAAALAGESGEGASVRVIAAAPAAPAPPPGQFVDQQS